MNQLSEILFDKNLWSKLIIANLYLLMPVERSIYRSVSLRDNSNNVIIVPLIQALSGKMTKYVQNHRPIDNVASDKIRTIT